MITMDLEFIKRQAAQGKEWAIKKLQEAGQALPGAEYEKLQNNSNNNMDSFKQSDTRKAKWIGFRCPNGLYDIIQQHRYCFPNKGLSSIIKEALYLWHDFQIKLNELKIQELQKKAAYEISMGINKL